MSDIKIKPAIQSGYEGTNVPEDFFIPPVGIEDADRALFNLFDKRLAFEVEIDQQVTRVPVVFAAGERFALTRRRQPVRDKNNALILPIISIHRNSIIHDPAQSGYGTPISHRDQSTYVVKKRLSKKDREYQKIINKLSIANQSNVASVENFQNNVSGSAADRDAIPGRIASRRERGNSKLVQNPTGYHLAPNLGDNIFEIITVPYPTFFVIEYEIMFWTQYMSQMNQLIESMMARFDGQGHEFQLETPTGYKFVAYVKSPITTQDNFSNFSDDERIIKYSFNISVPAYMIAPQQPGLPSPFRRFYSSPHIEFGIKGVSTEVYTQEPVAVIQNDPNKFILSDINTDNLNTPESLQRGQDSVRLLIEDINPFTGKPEKRLVKVLTRNQRTGETVMTSMKVDDLDIFSD